MKNRLYTLCWQIDGVHWLLIRADGAILSCSPCGFATVDEALLDLQYRI